MKKRENKPINLDRINNIVFLAIIFWSLYLFVQSISLYYYLDSMSFAGGVHMYTKGILLLLRYTSLMFVLLVLPVSYGLLKRKCWSWYIALVICLIVLGLFGSEIILTYFLNKRIPEVLNIVYRNLLGIIPSLIYLYYFTRSHVKRYFIHEK